MGNAIAGPGHPGHETLASNAAHPLDADAAYGTKPARTWARTAPVTDVDPPLDGSKSP